MQKIDLVHDENTGKKPTAADEAMTLLRNHLPEGSYPMLRLGYGAVQSLSVFKGEDVTIEDIARAARAANLKVIHNLDSDKKEVRYDDPHGRESAHRNGSPADAGEDVRPAADVSGVEKTA